MDRYIKITKNILNVFMTVIIIIGIIFIFLYLIGIIPYVVQSGSMEPAVHVGSICFINKRVKYEDMKVGDIIAFQSSKKMFVTHRIINITEEGFETKGDANEDSDGISTNKENFIGKNIFSIPKFGLFVATLQTKKGKIITGTIIIVIFLAGILIGEPSKKNNKNN